VRQLMTSAQTAVAAVTLVAIGILADCSPSDDSLRAESNARIAALAEFYVRVALELAQHNPELVDGWRGPDDWRPGPRQPVAPLLAEIEAIQRELGGAATSGSSRDRRDYLTAQVGALHVTATRLLGRSDAFADEAKRALGITPTPVNSSAIEHALGALDHELPGKGTLADRYAAFKRRLTIPTAQVEGVMRAALDVCRSATLSHISLPPDERVDLALVGGSPWDGYARYDGGHRTRIDINRDAALDVSRALRLACHEGYPGHHVQYLWIDDELVRKRQWLEFQLAPAFGRHLLLSEGAAEAGVDILFPDDTRAAVYRDTLLPAAGLRPSDAAQIVRIESLVTSLEPVISSIVAAYLDNSLTQAAAIERLRDEALLINPEAMLAFAERWRTRVLVYPEGRALVQRLIAGRGLEGLRHVFVDQPFAVQ
jgi:hypothetical protein